MFKAMEAEGGALKLRTAGGPEVRARDVVVAAGYESLRFLPVEVAGISTSSAA